MKYAVNSLLLLFLALRAEIHWQHLSSANGDLSDPGGSTEQTGVLVATLDKTRAEGLSGACIVPADRHWLGIGT